MSWESNEERWLALGLLTSHEERVAALMKRRAKWIAEHPEGCRRCNAEPRFKEIMAAVEPWYHELIHGAIDNGTARANRFVLAAVTALAANKAEAKRKWRSSGAFLARFRGSR